MSYLDPYEDEDLPSSNYIVRQWKGQNSLPFAYWVNGSILTALLSGISYAIGSQLPETGASLQMIAVYALASVALLTLIWIWSAVGIWRSADRHRYRGGSSGWATAAKFIVFLGCLGMLARLPGAFLQARELGQLAVGADPIGKPATIALRGADAVLLRGNLTQGSAKRLAVLIASAPSVRTLVLDSPGGRVLEGERIAELVRQHGLDTLAENDCASACTMPFLAGRHRLVAAHTRLGFHQPSFPGASRAEMEDGIADYKRFLFKANLEPGFVEKAVVPAPDDMWYPELRELKEAGAITGLDAGAVAEDNRISADQLNRRAPVRIDAMTTLIGAKAKGSVLEYAHRIDVERSRLDMARLRSALPIAVRRDICARPDMVFMIESGAIYRYSYVDTNGEPLLKFEINC